MWQDMEICNLRTLNKKKKRGCFRSSGHTCKITLKGMPLATMESHFLTSVSSSFLFYCFSGVYPKVIFCERMIEKQTWMMLTLHRSPSSTPTGSWCFEYLSLGWKIFYLYVLNNYQERFWCYCSVLAGSMAFLLTVSGISEIVFL